MGKLGEFIQSNPDPRELKRALAVQMVLKGYLYRQIAEILQVIVDIFTPARAITS